MTPTARGSPLGIVFRRLDADLERRAAARLLPDCDLEEHRSACDWYGLCDLTETGNSGLAGVAVVRSLEPGTSCLCALGMSAHYRGGRLGRRLVREVADRLRASGVEEITAPAALDDRVAGLLRRAGFAFRASTQEGGSGWLSLPL